MLKHIGCVRFSSLGCLLACLLLTAGCGGETGSEVKVSGNLTHNGQPLEMSDDAGVIMTFHELRNGQMGERTYAATVDKSGAYEVLLEPGEYRVAVQLMDPYATQVDKFRGAFDQAKSRVTVEISEAREELHIDLKQS